MDWTYIFSRAGLPPLPSRIIPLPLQHLPCLTNSLKQEMQLAKDETRIERVTRPRAHINDIQTLRHKISNRDQLRQNQFRRTRCLGQVQTGTGGTACRRQRCKTKLDILEQLSHLSDRRSDSAYVLLSRSWCRL
jgi:hypothetical protein